VIHELAIIRLLMELPKTDIKCVLIAPNKALCQQRLVEWQSSFGSLGVGYKQQESFKYIYHY
jgi:replicative superfamily II helicase